MWLRNWLTAHFAGMMYLWRTAMIDVVERVSGLDNLTAYLAVGVFDEVSPVRRAVRMLARLQTHILACR